MITGCNTNVRHGDKLFHVQTEDSGRANPRIVSHVYHGGTIIASEKRDYSDLVGSMDPVGSLDLDREVRGLIEEQHAVMLDRLKGGEFDAVIRKYLGGDSAGEIPSDSAGVATAPSLAKERESASSQSDSVAESKTASETDSKTSPALAFGDSDDTQRPLDEVILEYLVDKARDRASDREAKPPRKSRSKG